MSYSDEQTEKLLNNLEKKLNNLYKKAYKDITVVSAKYFDSFEKRDEKMREALKDGTYPELFGVNAGMKPEEHYKQWRLAQIGRGERWEAVRGEISKIATDANKEAEKIINDSLVSVYKLNHNYSAYEIEKGSGIVFNLIDADTLDELSRYKNHTDFKTVRVNPKRDYNWNTKRIHNALVSAISQGLSIPHLTDAFMEVMGSNRKAAIRNARTAYTSAQNAGRVESYKQAEELGIEIEQEWVSTSDDRVRDSHAELDGVRVGVGETFPNGCRYPADPAGEPSEVYNCRCTLRAIIPKYNGAQRTENTAASYNEWLEMKNGV